MKQKKISILAAADKAYCQELGGRPFTKHELREFVNKMEDPTVMAQDICGNTSGFPSMPSYERVRFLFIHSAIRQFQHL